MDTRGDAAGEAFWADADDDVALRRYRTLVNTVDDGIYERSRPSASGLDPEGEGRKPN